MQFMSLSGLTAPNAFRLRRSPTLSPRKASEPACRKSRRVIPSQKWTGLSASSLYIAAPPQKSTYGSGVTRHGSGTPSPIPAHSSSRARNQGRRRSSRPHKIGFLRFINNYYWIGVESSGNRLGSAVVATARFYCRGLVLKKRIKAHGTKCVPWLPTTLPLPQENNLSHASHPSHKPCLNVIESSLWVGVVWIQGMNCPTNR